MDRKKMFLPGHRVRIRHCSLDGTRKGVVLVSRIIDDPPFCRFAVSVEPDGDKKSPVRLWLGPDCLALAESSDRYGEIGAPGSVWLRSDVCVDGGRYANPNDRRRSRVVCAMRARDWYLSGSNIHEISWDRLIDAVERSPIVAIVRVLPGEGMEYHEYSNLSSKPSSMLVSPLREGRRVPWHPEWFMFEEHSFSNGVDV